MELEKLGFTENQINTLQKKGITSVEAFLRKQPLHYYDFAETMPLSKEDEKVKKHLAAHTPFAIIGTCTNYNVELKNHMQMVKLRVEDEQTGTTLFVNFMSSDALKLMILEQDENDPVNKPVELPVKVSNKNKIHPELINASCYKQILALNQSNAVTATAFSKLKTGGLDRISRMQLEKLEELVPLRTVTHIATLFDPDSAISCLRWIARGLNTDLAIRKTYYDNASVKDMLLNKKLIVGGNISYSEVYNAWSVLNPPVISADIGKFKKINVQYSQMKGFTASEYAVYIDKAIQAISDFEIIPSDILKQYNLLPLRASALYTHHPVALSNVTRARKRAIFDDLLYLAIKLKLNMPSNLNTESPKMVKTGVMEHYISSLPYELTKGQKDAIDIISEKMKKGEQANALVQGDVGTGKTCVAFALMMQAVENGYQAALAVPYTTLAHQHFRDIAKALEGTNIKAALITSECSDSEKRKIKNRLANGEVDIIIGTHSIFSDNVIYANLGLIIEDEEHKFGMVHRENFNEKGVAGCHKITMSATPIPKSLANTLYGESSEIITITDKPANRLPVKTAITGSDTAAAKEIIKQVQLGHQAYIVCPAIEKNDKTATMESIEVKERIYRNLFGGVKAKKANGNNLTMVVLTGKMSGAEKTKIMEAFSNGEVDVLMSTTVIEVGMNVPNATIMVITGADRFGFSTLHQLRGRVGRGSAQSYCVLQTAQPNEKLQFMQQTTDGFEIAEKDLEMRGPGSLFGDKQTGNNYFINLMLSFPKMYGVIKGIADEVCKNETGKEIVRRYEEIYLAEELR